MSAIYQLANDKGHTVNLRINARGVYSKGGGRGGGEGGALKSRLGLIIF